MSETYCQRFFVELYQEARAVPQNCKVHPFDFTLIALLRTAKKDTASIELASLLYYVRSFPLHFSLWPLNLRDETQWEWMFDAILDKARKLKLAEPKLASFPYEKQITLFLPEKSPIEASKLDAPESIYITQKPFESCRKALFKARTAPSHFGNEKLFEESLLSDQSLEKGVVKKYQSALKELSSQKTSTYTFREKNRTTSKDELEKRLKEYQSLNAAEEKNILKCLNDPYNTFENDISLHEECEFRLRFNACQTYVITPEMVMRKVLLTNSVSFLKKHRPMLKENHICAIVSAVHRYYHLLVLTSMCSEALELLDKPEDPIVQQKLLNLLNYEFLYEPEKYPEIAYMQIKTNKLPRKEQVIAYKWICEGIEKGENRHFQSPAGGGKSSYLVPLMILRSLRHGRVPFVLTTQAMYPLDRQNLKKTLGLLGIELDTLEINMNAQLDVKALQLIIQQFHAALQNGKAFILTPQSWYCLRLNYFTALIHGDKKAASLLQDILGFFREWGLLLGDESHRNFDPMTQAMFGLGNFILLTGLEQKLLMALAKPLFGMEKLICSNGKELSKMAQTKEIGKGKPEKDEIQIIQNTLAHHILKTFFQDIPKDDHSSLINFWIDKKAGEPPCLTNKTAEEKALLLLARYFFTTLVKQLLQMKTDLDHVRSKEQGGIDTPSYHKTPSHAQFKDHYLTFLLTIKGSWQRGLDLEQFKGFMETLKAQDLQERKIALKHKQTPTHVEFTKWVPELTLDTLDLTDQKMVEKVFASVSKNADAMEYYLKWLVLSKVGFSGEQFTSSPSHLMGGFSSSITFSATPLDPTAYPKQLKALKNDDMFEASVIAQSSQTKNQNYIFPKNSHDFFKHIGQNREKYAQVRHMVDAGGFFSREHNQEVAQKWLDASELDGVIYFPENGEKLCCSLKNGSEILAFNSMDEIQHLNHLKLGVFFDAPHAESAHFDPIPQTGAFILAGDALTLSHAIQSIMRERGFLDETFDQFIIWVVQEDLQKKMQGKLKQFSSSILHTWFLKNEIKAMKNGIIMAAYQDIILKIEAYGDNKLEGMREKMNPKATWGAQKKREKTDTVLWEFAKKQYAKFKFETPFEENSALKEAIKETIDSVHQKISKIVVDFDKNAVSEMHQKCVVKSRVRSIQFKRQLTDLEGEPVVKHGKIKESSYLLSMQKHAISAREAFKTDRLSENFYIESNQLNTASSHDVSLKEQFLKTIDFLLIIVTPEGQYVAEAVSNDLLPKYIKHLDAQTADQEVQHQAFIIRSDGVLYHTGKGGLAPRDGIINSILHSEWLQDVLIDAALLSGKLLYNERFKERISRWPNFLEFWQSILKALPLQQEMSANALLAFLPEMQNEEELT